MAGGETDMAGGGVDLYRLPKLKKREPQMCAVNAAGAFRGLWEQINGPEGWLANPWIVALTFTVERRNIDA